MTDLLAVSVQLEPPFVDKNTAAQLLGNISTDKLEQLVRAGEIAAKTVGKRVVFEPDEIRRFARECPSWEPRRSA
ncbi:helix-turn-helix domain-containing protein [Micrococcus luteus]|uniref:helix-turn-helix domain-containing protein n=1 Tax=Micrococcus luteus TaxID=1270 RepID=UPI00343D47A9